MIVRLVLIDGEHYPDVTAWAVEKLGDVCCAVFLGGTEKVGDLREIEEKIGVRVYYSRDYMDALRRAVEENDVCEVIDLSDEPILTYEDRFRIASFLLASGITYTGADFMFKPKPPLKMNKPSLAVIGTGKRVGKTAVSGFVARVLKEIAKPAILTMGRGGPEKPEIIEGDRLEITPEFLLKISEEGKHAASDHFEDALTSRVLTVGCRRCGGGMAGFSFFDIVEEGVKIAERLDNDLIILEGSGATIPAVKADGCVTVVGATQKMSFIRGYFGPFRIKLADIVVVTMADLISGRKLESIRRVISRINPDADLHMTKFIPRPLGRIDGRRILLIMTANRRGLQKTASYLEEHYGVEVVGFSSHLSNRRKLAEDMRRFRGYDAVLVELKAAAVDVVTRKALEEGREVVFMDNEPVNVDGKNLRESILNLGKRILEGGG